MMMLNSQKRQHFDTEQTGTLQEVTLLHRCKERLDRSHHSNVRDVNPLWNIGSLITVRLIKKGYVKTDKLNGKKEEELKERGGEQEHSK